MNRLIKHGCFKCKLMKTNKIFLLFFVFALVLVGLTDCSKKTPAKEAEAGISVEQDSTSIKVLYKNTYFFLPSPYISGLIIKSNHLVYKDGLLNLPSNAGKYTTNLERALNLGVYCTDIGYLTLFERIQNSSTYFTAIKRLSEGLELKDFINLDFMDQVQKNIGSSDSVIFLLSKALQHCDGYLKDNERGDIAVMILAGSWIESLDIIGSYYGTSKNQEISSYIANQKSSLENLIKLMAPYYELTPENTEITDKFVDLAYEFDVLDFTFKSAKAETHVSEKLTLIKSTSEVTSTDDQIEKIHQKVHLIKQFIIQ
jgi:hypothetical protein